MTAVKTAIAWLGIKGAAFLFSALLLLVVALAKGDATTEAFGMWLAALYGVLAGSNAAITIGTREKPAPKAEPEEQQGS